jgi:hypothetical protein
MIGAVPPRTLSDVVGDIRLSMDGVRIRVRSDEPAVIDAVDTSYAAFRVADGTPDGEAEVSIETWRATGRDEPSMILGTLDRIVMAVIDGMADTRVLAIHAATVVVDGRAVVLAGRSGAGKSTLTLALLRAGAQLLTDELTLIDGDGSTVLPYPRAVHVSPTTVELLPELGFLRERPRRALGADLEWSVSTADLARAFSTSVAGPSQLGAVVLLEPRGDPSDDPRIESVGAAQAAMELARGTPASARDFMGTVRRLASIAGSVPTVRLVATDLGPTTGMLLDHLAASA